MSKYTGYTDKCKERTMRYMKDKRDRIVVGVPKGDKERYNQIVKKSGRKSLNALIVELLEEFSKAYEDK